MKTTHNLATALAALALLSGCDTLNTNPDALAFANNTVKLMSQAEKDAAAYAKAFDDARDARVNAIVAQKERMGSTSADLDVRYRARESAGDSVTTAIRTRLLADAAHSAALDEAVAGLSSSYEAKVKALLQPLPNPSPALTAAQAKAAAMGQELSADTRRTEGLAFVKAVLESAKANRKIVEKAKAAAAAAAASSALTGPSPAASQPQS